VRRAVVPHGVVDHELVAAGNRSRNGTGPSGPTTSTVPSSSTIGSPPAAAARASPHGCVGLFADQELSRAACQVATVNRRAGVRVERWSRPFGVVVWSLLVSSGGSVVRRPRTFIRNRLAAWPELIAAALGPEPEGPRWPTGSQTVLAAAVQQCRSVISKRRYCLDLYHSARSCGRDSENSDCGAVIAPNRARCGVGSYRIDSGREIDRQLGNIFGTAPASASTASTFRMACSVCASSPVKQCAGAVRSVLPADIQRRPSGNDHPLGEGGTVMQLWRSTGVG
jgi:hypothetical protein